MDLKSDVRRLILSSLPHDKNDPQIVAELQAKPIATLLVIYHNWLSRLLRPTQRSVHLSREFLQNPMRATHAAGLAATLSDIEYGRDLSPRLSKLVVNGYSANSSSQTKDKDLMLNDWGIHHLHLGTVPDPKDPVFVGRTRELLFVIFRPSAAYILDIFRHAAWADRDIVRIAIGNWPDLELFLELKGILGAARSYTEHELQKLRQAGITSFAEVDGRIFVGRGMISTAGTGINSVRAADRLLEAIEKCEEASVRDPGRITRLLTAARVTPPAHPEFEFIFLEDGYGVREKKTGAIIDLGGH